MIADATGKKSQDQNLYLMTEKSSYQVQNHVVFLLLEEVNVFLRKQV